MKRSRRRVSRALITILALAIGISTVCVLRKRSSSQNAAPPALSAVDAMVTAAIPQTQPAAVSVAQDQTPAPIETATPTSGATASLGGSAVLASATISPTSRPSGEVETSVRWSHLLSTGTSDGSMAATTQPLVTGNGPLADAHARVNAGDLLDARRGLNDCLQSGQLSSTDNAAAMALASDMNQSLVFSARTFANDPYTAAYLVRPGDSLAKIAATHSTTWELLSRINRLDPRHLRAGSRIKTINGPFFGVVRKTAFAMDLYLGGLPGEAGSMYVMTFPVGLGKDDSTPTGTWAIGPHAKLKHPTYYPPEGGPAINADDPKNPLGGYWIALTGIDGQAVGRMSYGIHGTIDPDSIGKQASMGCIRLKNADIALVFDLMVEGKSKVCVKP